MGPSGRFWCSFGFRLHDLGPFWEPVGHFSGGLSLALIFCCCCFLLFVVVVVVVVCFFVVVVVCNIRYCLLLLFSFSVFVICYVLLMGEFETAQNYHDLLLRFTF